MKGLVQALSAMRARFGGFQVNSGFVLLATLLLLAPGVQAEEITFVHPDHLGSPVAYTDGEGNVIGREYYTPYGDSLNAPTTDNTVSYTGHYRDGDTGLIYMQARYYDPVMGRFLSVDPVTFDPDNPEHFNRYWYANGNPYLYTDPDGREVAGITLDANIKQLMSGQISKNEYNDMLTARANGALLGLGAVTGGGATAIAGIRILSAGMYGSETAMYTLGAASSALTVTSELGELAYETVTLESPDITMSDVVDVTFSLIPGGGESMQVLGQMASISASVLEAVSSTPNSLENTDALSCGAEFSGL